MRSPRSVGVVLAIALVAAPRAALATPLDFIPVDDPIQDEIRILDVLAADSLPHLSTKPLQVFEVPSLTEPGTGAVAITRARIRRALAYDRATPDRVAGASPRLLQLSYAGDERVEASVGLEGSGRAARGVDPDFTSPSGAHLRFGVQVDRWNLRTHVTVGHVARGLDFAASVFDGNDAVLHSEEAYLSYTGTSGLWSVQIGRDRWHWGPGDEGGLLLSKTSAPLTGIALSLRVPPLHADGTVFWATLAEPTGQQVAAHRLEWQPLDRLRVGVSEAVRYQSQHWEPLYGVGILPYALVQELLFQDQPDSANSQRNNVVASLDAALRLRPGHRVYGELLIDDLRTNSAPIVSKYAYLLGWESAATLHGRLTTRVEYARLTRFVYTSSFGRSFVSQGLPLGYPTGPDTRRIHASLTWDPTVAWQLFGSFGRTDAGESGLDHPFEPTDPRVSVTEFLGVVQHSSLAEAGLRWWPAAGIDLSLGARFERIDNAAHVSGDRRIEPGAELQLRIVR